MRTGQIEQDLFVRKSPMKNSFPLRIGALAAAAVFFTSPLPAEDETPPPQPLPIDAILQQANLWATPPADLESLGKPLGFTWTSTAQRTLRNARPGLTFRERPLNEVLLAVEDGKFAEATLIYFSRGDAGQLNENSFDELLAAITGDLTALTGQEPNERGRDTTSAVKAEGRIWTVNGTEYLLEWSVTKESRTKGIPWRAEFIRLTVHPEITTERAIGERAPKNASRAAVKSFNGAEHVEKEADGTVLLTGIPMVDQGQKGYCVVASAERVLNYYGAEVDQHELAQIANSDASKGTSPDAMFDSLKRLTARFGIKSRALVEWDYRDFMKMISDYNRATKRGKLAPEIFTESRDLDSYYEPMDPKILKEVRLKKKADFGRFQRDIQSHIDEGIPLLWSVRLGLIAEKGLSQARGGHMRLIIGYDPKNEQIVYSDSWGRGHEQKRMSYEDAWTITSSLTSLQPVGS